MSPSSVYSQSSLFHNMLFSCFLRWLHHEKKKKPQCLFQVRTLESLEDPIIQNAVPKEDNQYSTFYNSMAK